MKKLISLVLCLGMLMGILSVASFAAEESTTLVEKSSTWKYLAYEIPEGGEAEVAPSGWEKGTDSATWQEGQAPFAGSAWTHSSAVTVFPYGSFNGYIKTTFTVADANAIQSLKLNVIYDEDPVVYINGVQVWSTTGYHDGGYKEVDITDAALDALKTGNNTIAVYFKNAIGGGGSVFDCELVATSGAEAIVDGKAVVRSAVGYNAAGVETKNPFGDIGYEDNLFDADVGSVWGWGEDGIYVVVNLVGKVNVTDIFLQTKNEGALANNEGSHGKYTVEAWVDGQWKNVGTVDALINGTTLEADVETNKIKVTAHDWANDNWVSIAELSISAEVIENDTPVEPPKNGDATVFAVVFAAVAMLGMAVVVTKKVNA